MICNGHAGVLIGGNICFNCERLMDHMKKNIGITQKILNEIRGINKLQEDGGKGVWSEHPKFSRCEWGEEAYEHDTVLGYWDWVIAQIEQEKSDPETQTELEL